MEVSILFPCRNEAETVAACVEAGIQFLNEHGIKGEVLVADNGSSDGSADLAANAGARILSVAEPGYGNALKAGIQAARATYIIMMDADGSYDLEDAGLILDRLRAGDQFVVGNRFAGGIDPGAMPALHRYLGNPLLSGLGRLLYPCPIRDFHCGIRGGRADALKKLGLQCPGMEFASEMVIRAVQAGLQMSEVPARLHPDGRTGKPHLRPLVDGSRHLRLLLHERPMVHALVLFCLTVLICLGLLLAATALPRSMLEKNLYASMQELSEKEGYDYLVKGRFFTMIDNHADGKWLSILWSADSSHPYRAAMDMTYYYGQDGQAWEPAVLKDLVEGTAKGTYESYSRYWHGALTLIRPLFCLFPIGGVRACLFALAAILFGIAVCLLWKRGCRWEGAGLILAFCLVNAWMLAFCLEYSPTFILAGALLALIAGKPPDTRGFLALMTVAGVLTSYVDFLTTETVTLLLPLLLYLSLSYRKRGPVSFGKEALFVGQAGAFWLLPYGLMYLVKWLLAGGISQSFAQAAYRMSTATYAGDDTPKALLPLEGILRNLQCFFCMGDRCNYRQVALAAFLACFGLFLVWYLVRRNPFDPGQGIILLLGLVPLVRFGLLGNHSFYHFFFSYRALASTVFALFLFFGAALARRKGEK